MKLFNILELTAAETLNADTLCGEEGGLTPIFDLLGKAFQLLLIGIPVLLVIFGLIDLGKAVMAGEDKEIKAAQKMLLKRAIYTLLAFLLLGIVKAVLKLVSTEEANEVVECLGVIFG